ncbi:MAG TPA: asparagine synthase (glutamine-hydrolyzing) [Pyrinomonadaceae bacterium]|nr:asparagine synthase (glutamine-hydrolyzing) [Pyrinomonadaceae bacterium]
MCSISGILKAGQFSSELSDVVRRMNDAQQHRGPDDQGIAKCEFHGGEVVLGNTRLAIIDTSEAGHQPMNDPVTGNWITYNGETYNFKNLRTEIPGPWSSNTDTEVVLRAYSKLGTEAFNKLRGMFALALWDNQKQTLVLARDPLGIKPLYYYASADQFVFASELRALLATGLIPRKLSAAGLDSYLANGSVETPLTIVDGIKQLLPGHVLHVSINDARQIEVADTEFTAAKPQSIQGNREDAVARLRHELEESVRLHLVSDVPLGVFLSGGMDSSALVALMSEIGTRPKTFSIVFDETKFAKFTEGAFSRAVAERFNTDHSEIRLSEDRLLEILPGAITSLDQPTMDGINTFVVSSAVKSKGITVALSGLGGDELFAGYPSFRRALKFDAMSRMSKRALRVASGVGQFVMNGSVVRDKFWQLANSGGTADDVYRISRQLFSVDSVKRITGRNGHKHTRNGNHDDADIVNSISRLELTGYMTNTLLRDTDAMSMAHSLEVRVPFVDTKVVDYVLSLPGEWKMPSRVGPKPLLADAMADLLPREFLNRPKMGFTLPFEKWLQTILRGEVGSVLERPIGGLNGDAVQDVWRRFLEKPRAVGWSRPWSLYVLARWCEINGVS